MRIAAIKHQLGEQALAEATHIQHAFDPANNQIVIAIRRKSDGHTQVFRADAGHGFTKAVKARAVLFLLA
jgi:hypothetical protein